MGVGYNPKIVTDQLSMYVDVSNPKSWPGSGTKWYDLGPNKLEFTATGATQTPEETIGGVKSFAFNGSGYWECGTNFSTVDFGGDCTLLMWMRSEDNTTRKTIFEKAGTTYASYQQEIAVTWETSDAFSYYSRYDISSGNPGLSYDYASAEAVSLNAWSLLGIKMSSGKTTTARTGFWSINGNAWTANYISRTAVAVTPSGAIRIGTGYAGTIDNGNIGSVICYNKMLNDAEIQQNFNALRGRFGI